MTTPSPTPRGLACPPSAWTWRWVLVGANWGVLNQGWLPCTACRRRCHCCLLLPTSAYCCRCCRCLLLPKSPAASHWPPPLSRTLQRYCILGGCQLPPSSLHAPPAGRLIPAWPALVPADPGQPEGRGQQPRGVGAEVPHSAGACCPPWATHWAGPCIGGGAVQRKQRPGAAPAWGTQAVGCCGACAGAMWSASPSTHQGPTCQPPLELRRFAHSLCHSPRAELHQAGLRSLPVRWGR